MNLEMALLHEFHTVVHEICAKNYNSLPYDTVKIFDLSIYLVLIGMSIVGTLDRPADVQSTTCSLVQWHLSGQLKSAGVIRNSTKNVVKIILSVKFEASAG